MIKHILKWGRTMEQMTRYLPFLQFHYQHVRQKQEKQCKVGLSQANTQFVSMVWVGIEAISPFGHRDHCLITLPIALSVNHCLTC